MSDSSFIGSMKKNYKSLIHIFSKSDSDPERIPQRPNAFNVKLNRRLKYPSMLAQREVVAQLIDLYRQNACLWNPSCPDYKSAEYQEQVWRNIAKAIDVNMPVVEVKRKVQVLRNKWEALKESPLPKMLDFPDFGFLMDDSYGEKERMGSGSEKTNSDSKILVLAENQELKHSFLSERKIDNNKTQHIANLCEVNNSCISSKAISF